MEFILFLTNVSFTVWLEKQQDRNHMNVVGGFTVWLEKQQDRNHMNVVGVCGMILVILILKKKHKSSEWIHGTQERDHWGIFGSQRLQRLASCRIISFPRETLVNEISWAQSSLGTAVPLNTYRKYSIIQSILLGSN